MSGQPSVNTPKYNELSQLERMAIDHTIKQNRIYETGDKHQPINSDKMIANAREDLAKSPQEIIDHIVKRYQDYKRNNPRSLDSQQEASSIHSR